MAAILSLKSSSNCGEANEKNKFFNLKKNNEE